MDIDLIILWRLFKDGDLRLEPMLKAADAQCLRELITMLGEIKGSLSSSLSHIWNVTRYYESRTMWSDDVAVMAACIDSALQLPDDDTAVSIMWPLASSILRIRDALLNRGNGMLEERELGSDQAVNTSQRLLSRLASRMIFGQRNSVAVSCARASATSEARPSIKQLAPYEG